MKGKGLMALRPFLHICFVYLFLMGVEWACGQVISAAG
jgi:hypothetical protein